MKNSSKRVHHPVYDMLKALSRLCLGSHPVITIFFLMNSWLLLEIVCVHCRVLVSLYLFTKYGHDQCSKNRPKRVGLV